MGDRSTAVINSNDSEKPDGNSRHDLSQRKKTSISFSENQEQERAFIKITENM